ncbi:MAG TPA: hypothetical protein VJ521_12515, partial [Acidobacteriota bacterium]|nr:hypothetical protein [Acidobacteriota bacterium]
LDSLHIANLAINAGLPSSLFAASGIGPVYRSLDQGRHWTSVKDLTTDYIGEIKIHPRNSNVIFASSDPDPGISADGGETWTFTKLPTPYSASVVAFHPQDPQMIYVGTSGGGMVKTTDLGKTWKVINSGLGKKSISAIAVDPHNGANLFVATNSDSYTGRARVFKTVNGGTTWTSVSTGLNGPRILSLAIDPTSPATLYLVQQEYVFFDIAAKFVYKSIDSGQHWTQKTRGLPQSFFGGFGIDFIVVDPSNSQTLFSIGWNSIYTSTDGAENWTRFSLTGLESDLEIDALQINPAEPRILYIGTSRGVFSFQR